MSHLNVEEYWGSIPSKEHREVEDFVSQYDLGEKFEEHPDVLFVGRKEGEIKVVVAYRLSGCDSGKVLPRFIHVIVHPDIRRSKLIVWFLMQTEIALLREGYNQITAYIYHRRSNMQELARKFGFTKYHETKEGVFMYKNIGVRK